MTGVSGFLLSGDLEEPKAVRYKLLAVCHPAGLGPSPATGHGWFTVNV